MNKDIIERSVKKIRATNKMNCCPANKREVYSKKLADVETNRPDVMPTYKPMLEVNGIVDYPQNLAQGNKYHLNQRVDDLEDEIVDHDIFMEGIQRENNYGMLFELGQDRPPQPSQVDNMPYNFYNRGGGAMPSAQWLRANGFAVTSANPSGGSAYANPKMKNWLYGSVEDQLIRANFIGGADGRYSTNTQVGAVQRAEANRQIEASIENIKGRRNRDNQEYIHDVKTTDNSQGYAPNGHNVPEMPVSLGVTVAGFQQLGYNDKEVRATNDHVMRINHTPISSY